MFTYVMDLYKKKAKKVSKSALSIPAGKTKDDLVPFSGFKENNVETPFVDGLSDEDLKHLNQILDWNCFTADSHGRRFGLPAGIAKRVVPQIIPDPRIEMLNKEINLKDKTVLEVGCFEGIHTIGLCKFAKDVIAVDSRIENVVKTLVRLGFFNLRARVFKCDLESIDNNLLPMLKADVLHHVGVLYHLKDPVKHLLDLPKYISEGIMLDTHFAEPEKVNKSYSVNGKTYQYQHYNEGGKKEVFSGMYDHAKWLLLDDIVEILKSVGFSQVKIVEKRQERNGSRVLLIAKK